MADITKRVNKRAAEHLGDEQADAVLLCEMKGGLGAGAVGAVVAQRTTERSMKKRTADRLVESGGVAASFPAATAVVAVTPTRVIVMPSNGLTFQRPTLVVDRKTVGMTVVGWRGLGRRVEIEFEDGSTVEVDVAPFQPLEQCIARLTRS